MSTRSYTQSHWARSREKGTYLGIRLVLFLYKWLGPVLLMPILYPIVFYFFVFGTDARESSRLYLNRALNHNADPDSRVWVGNRHSFLHFMAFAQSMLYKFAGWTGRITRADIHFPTRDQLIKAVQSGRGGIIAGAHLGTIEVGRALSRDLEGFKLNVLVHTHHAENFNRVMKTINPEFQAELIQVTSLGADTAILLKQKVEKGEFVAILGDRTPVASQGREIWVPFFGKPAPFPQGPYILAAVLNCPLYMLNCLKRPGGFDVYFDQLADQVVLPRKSRQQAIAQYAKLYVEKLEHYTTLYPYQWFNFFDFWRELPSASITDSER